MLLLPRLCATLALLTAYGLCQAPLPLDQPPDLPPDEDPPDPVGSADPDLLHGDVPVSGGDPNVPAAPHTAGDTTADAGGDGCAWYEDRKELCGCCDEGLFVAQRHCTACLEPLQRPAVSDVQQWLAPFPNKTTALHCAGCGLVGMLPTGLPQRFPLLKVVDLSNNRLSGAIPKDLWELPMLKELHLHVNVLSGELTDGVAAAKGLKLLYLYSNLLSGPVPKGLGHLAALEELRLAENRFSGELPEELGGLRRLKVLDMADNSLTGSLPSSVGNWSELSGLLLNNNGLTGALPAGVGSWHHVGLLQLSNNRFSGQLPDAVGAWVEAYRIILAENLFEGPLPPAVRGWRALKNLFLSKNKFSGSLPAEVGGWGNLEEVHMSHNRLTGSIPQAVENWRRVTVVDLSENMLEGQLPPEVSRWGAETVLLSGNQLSGAVPAAIGQWRNAKELRLARNMFTALPAEMAAMSQLEKLDVSYNALEGVLPDLDRLVNLEELDAGGNLLQGVGKLPQRLQTLNLGSNRLPKLPDALVQHSTALVTLSLRDNLISSWPPGGVMHQCSLREPRFGWPRLTRLDVSGNSLGEAATFLASLAYLDSLEELLCRGCGLKGAVTLHGMDAGGCGAEERGFAKLTWLDLADNGIEAMRAAPPAGLHHADLSDNMLEELHRGWFNENDTAVLQELRVTGNARLRADVAPAVVPCRESRGQGLAADPMNFVDLDGGKSCTDLCGGLTMIYMIDHALNSSALCKCRAGHMLSEDGCKPCHKDSYSMDVGGGVRECRACPALSSTEGALANELRDCKCMAGRYMNLSMGACSVCRQHPFRATRLPGQDSPEACSCSSSYSGLKEFGGVCGCHDGSHMDHVSRSCEPCSHAERCMWGTTLQRSLHPPAVKPGYWAEPVRNMSSFRKNNIWRCAGKFSCLANSTCAPGRGGLACGLCLPRHYGGSNGPCWHCPFVSPQMQRLLIAVVVLAVLPVPLLLHYALVAQQGSLQLLLQLRAVRGSLKQMVKHIQTVSVIGRFSVSWPAMAQAFFDLLDSFTLNVPTFSAIACTSAQTSAGLEMGAKWALPLLFVALTFAGMPASRLLTRLVRLGKRTPLKRWLPAGEMFNMGPWDAARVLLFTALLFWSTLAANAVEFLICERSPNGLYSVASYPHVRCSLEFGEWLPLALLSLLAFCMYILAPLRIVQKGLEEASESLACSTLSDRGWYAFILDDFRDAHLSWVMRIMMKDALLAAIPVIMPGWGAAQLLCTAALMATHTVLVMRNRPFQDQSNTLLETWNGATAVTLCVYSVGMGYSQTPLMKEVEELFEGGTDDPIYRGRAIGMVVVQVVSVVVPAAVLAFQLFNAVPRTSRLVPKTLKPRTRQQMSKWINSFLEQASNLDNFAVVLRALDDTDISSFRNIFEHTPAVLGHKLSESSASALVKRVSQRSKTQEMEEEGSNSQTGEGSQEIIDSKSSTGTVPSVFLSSRVEV